MFVRNKLTTDNIINNKTITIEDKGRLKFETDEKVEDYLIDKNSSADISIVNMASPDPVIVGDKLTYSLVVKNAGPSDAENVILQDVIPEILTGVEFSIDEGVTWSPWVSFYNMGTLPSATSITILIRGTVRSDAKGTITNIATTSSNCIEKTLAAESIATILIGETVKLDAKGKIINKASVKSYSKGKITNKDNIKSEGTAVIPNTATVSSTTWDPDLTNNSSKVITMLETLADVSVVKTVDTDRVIAREDVIYKLIILNKGPSGAENVSLDDTVPHEILNPQFSLNGGKTWNIWLSPYSIGTLDQGESVTILIRGTISETASGIVRNAATVSSTTKDPDLTNNSSSIDEKVKTAKLEVVKFVDKTEAKIGEILTYTATVKNTGSIALDNVVFKDSIPAGTSLVPSSVSINYKTASQNLRTGIKLGTLQPSEIVKVGFKVKIQSISCPSNIINKASTNFQYTIGDNIVEKSVESNKVVTDVGLTSFKQLSRQEYVKIPEQKPDVEDILNTLVDIKITDIKVIKTPTIKSVEGQNLTGSKLIVQGMLNQKVEYIAKDKAQSVHEAHFRIPFSTFIVLPENYVGETTIEIESIIEDVYTKLVDERLIFNNISFMLKVRFA